MSAPFVAGPRAIGYALCIAMRPATVGPLLALLSLASLAQAQPSEPEQPAAPPPDEYGAVATATRSPRPLRDVPAVVTVLRRDELVQNPALSTDGLLRTLPSALTFRRSTSLVADPSSQGLNLRGVGPSAVSRTLVLVDGIPANDPFAGSIYWRALPRIGIERIEVVPSGSSALYGSAALAGVVQLFSRPLRESFEADAQYGSLDTLQLAARGAYEREHGGAALEGEWLRSDGYRVVASDQAGAIDRPADSEHLTLNGRAELRPHERLRLNASMRLFRERQNGGTRFTTARVSSALVGLGGELTLPRDAALTLQLHGRVQRFEQERARITEGRSSETRSARQDVPADDEGGSLVYRSPPLARLGTHVITTGLDARRIAGVSREQLFPPVLMESSVRARDAGGEQLLFGAFFSDSYEIDPRLRLELTLRADAVQNRAGERELTRENGQRERTRFDARTDYALSPRLGVLLRPIELLALRASGYRAFRAPTLNELYRPFQVGTIVTAANATLRPELLHGFEAGIELTPLDALTLRATGFWNHLSRPISNVTLAEPRPDGAQRERRNLGVAVVRGLESSLAWRLARRFTGLLAYTFAHSEVRDAGAERALRGKQLPQDPRHRASALLMYDDPASLGASVQVRLLGAQYEDDLNTLRMARYAVVDVGASYRVFWRLELYATIENLFNQAYLVGRAGVDTVGQPFVARGGVRIRERGY